MEHLHTIFTQSIQVSRTNRHRFTLYVFVVAVLFLIGGEAYSQGVAINTSGAPADTSAMLDVSSLTKGMLIPRMTKVQRSAILSPATGLMVYQTDSTDGLYINVGTPASPSWFVCGDPAGNTALGVDALISNTGYDNTAIGENALSFNTAGYENTAIGSGALISNKNGTYNTATGAAALSYNTTGFRNTATGTGALSRNTTGYQNAAIGDDALSYNTTGGQNTAFGSAALPSNDTGNYNTAIGAFTLNYPNAGSKLTALGHSAGVSAPGLTNATAIGYNAKVGASNSLVLGGTGTDVVKVGIGTTTPVAPLEVSGSPQGYMRVTTASSTNGSVLEMKTNMASPNYIGAINFINSANSVPGQIAYLGSDALTVRTNNVERLRINSSGNVGIGTTTPTGALEVNASSNIPLLRLNQTNSSNFASLKMHNAAGYAWDMDVTNTSNPNLEFFNSNGVDLVNFDWSGNVYANTFNPGSDRNSKENFASIDADEILAKVTSLPITRWNYKIDKKVMHLGPMAQDFRAAFGLGTDEKHIATVDADGVALAAIQGLNTKVEGLVKESRDLKEELSSLKAENAQLKKVNDEMRETQAASSVKIARIETILQTLQSSSAHAVKVSLNGSN